MQNKGTGWRCARLSCHPQHLYRCQFRLLLLPSGSLPAAWESREGDPMLRPLCPHGKPGRSSSRSWLRPGFAPSFVAVCGASQHMKVSLSLSPSLQFCFSNKKVQDKSRQEQLLSGGRCSLMLRELRRITGPCGISRPTASLGTSVCLPSGGGCCICETECKATVKGSGGEAASWGRGHYTLSEEETDSA